MNKYRVQVDRVIDGDTFYGKVLLNDFDTELVNRKFRLIGVNTPERGRELYYEAKEYTAQAIDGKVVFIEVFGVDVFGRFLVTTHIPGSQKTLNELLLEEGLAVVYVKK